MLKPTDKTNKMNNMNEIIFNKKRSKSPLVILLTVLCFPYLFAVNYLLAFTIHVITTYKEASLASAIAIIVMCLTATIYVLDLILWQIIGKEKIEITNNELKVRQYGRIFCKKRNIPLESIKGIFERNYSAKGINKFWTPTKQGKLKISTTQKDIFIGRNIDEAETQSIIQELQSKLTHNISVSTINEIRDYNRNEIMFYIWVVSSIAIFLPAYIWVPFYRDYEELAWETRLSYLEENYPKKYCYIRVACLKSADACILDFCDSTHMGLYYKECDSVEEQAYEVCNDSTITSYTRKSIIPHRKGRRIYKGIVYVKEQRDSLCVVYANKVDLHNPFFVNAKYVHDSLHEDIDELVKTYLFKDYYKDYFKE